MLNDKDDIIFSFYEKSILSYYELLTFSRDGYYIYIT
jgi:hypothetical protein